MPTRVNKVCTTPHCPNAGEYRGKCKDHASLQETIRNKGRTASRAVYDSARWRKTRLIVLAEEPYCRWPESLCPFPSEHVDHIIPIEEGGDPWDRGNQQGLCARHHNVKSRRELQRRHGD